MTSNKKNKKNNNFEVVMPEKITKMDDDTYIMSTFDVKRLNDKRVFEKASFDFLNTNKMHNRFINDLDAGEIQYTLEDINKLAVNPQNKLSDIEKINKICKFYVNKDDLVGKVYETIENNVNTSINCIFSEFEDKQKSEDRKKAELTIKQFNRKIGLTRFARQAIGSTYIEGNFITYLRENNSQFTIDIYPLSLIEISDYQIDGEPLILMNIKKLEAKLKDVAYKDSKGNNLIGKFNKIEDELKANFPKEVYDAWKNKEKFALLEPANTGVIRINNLNGKYGLTPIFRTLSSQIMLDLIDNADKKNTASKGKKILAQLLDPALLGEKKNKTKHFDELNYAHRNLLNAWKNDIVLVTAPAFVKDIKYVEPKAETTNVNTINYYRNKILTALGISFLSSENNTSFNTADINVKELLRTVNKIAEQLEMILYKYYNIILSKNGLGEEYIPDIDLVNSELLEYDLKLKMADSLFNKFGASHRTTYEMLGVDFENEKIRRKEENEQKLSETLFYARETNYTHSGKTENTNVEEKNSKTEENQNKNKVKQANDKIRNKKIK